MPLLILSPRMLGLRSTSVHSKFLHRITSIMRCVRGNHVPLHAQFCLLARTADSVLHPRIQKHLTPWGCCLNRARTVRAPCVLLRILCPPDPQCLNLSCPGLSPDCLCTTTAPTGIGCRPLSLALLQEVGVASLFGTNWVVKSLVGACTRGVVGVCNCDSATCAP